MNTGSRFWDKNYLDGHDYAMMNNLLLDRILDYAGGLQKTKSRAKTALDLGCGTGDLAIKLAKRGYEVIGIDFSGEAIKKAEKRLKTEGIKNSVRFIKSELESISLAELKNTRFSMIFCKLVWAFIRDKKKLLKMVGKIMTRGSFFVIITPVLYENILYEDHLKKISVPAGEISPLLKTHFKFVKIIHENYFGENGSEITYFCGNSKLPLRRFNKYRVIVSKVIRP